MSATRKVLTRCIVHGSRRPENWKNSMIEYSAFRSAVSLAGRATQSVWCQRAFASLRQ
jgi:hypothetical protein